MQTFTSSCLDPGFGYENGDGYVRVWDIPKPRGGRLVMRHRWFWELQVGHIPEGYEINHLCKNRRCCNVKHLECITVAEHRRKTNTERCEDDVGLFAEWYKDSGGAGLSQAAIGRKFGITQSTVSQRIKKIKKANLNKTSEI